MKNLVCTIAAISALYALGVDHKGFGRLECQNIVTAPSALVVRGVYTGEVLLTTNDYWNCGWRSVVDVPPTVDDKHYAVPTGWVNRAEHYIDRAYEVKDIVIHPRQFYKYDISVAAMENGEITNLVTFISADIGVKWMWDAAEIIVETDPYFVTGTNAVIKSGVISADKVVKILDRAYELGQQTEAK